MTLDEILAVRDRHPIIEVLGRLGVTPPDRWNGATDFMINCPSPAHEDRTPSCIVHPQTDRYFCFGCGIHGDVLQLVQDVQGRAPLRDVAAFLADTSVPVVRVSNRLAASKTLTTGVNLARTSLSRVLEVNATAWEELSSNQAATVACRYLHRRGIDLTALDGRVRTPVAGYTPAQRDGLVALLRDHGYADEEIVDAGWGLDVDGRTIDRFHRRVLFPVVAPDESLRGVVGRDITGVGRRRYLNTPRTVAYAKGELLYVPAVGASRRTIVVCEGPVDSLAVIAAACREGAELSAVATAGTALTRAHTALIAGLGARQVAICSDGDSAGESAASEWERKLKELGLLTRRLRPPRGLDPAEWLASRRNDVNPSIAQQLRIDTLDF